MLVGRTSQEDLTVGLIVDQAQGIRQLPIEQIEKPTAGIESQISPYLLGTYEHESNLLVVLDLDSVLASTEIRQFEPL
jgi:chemotaxis signal transduction protein